jgi:hypothetical protein
MWSKGRRCRPLQDDPSSRWLAAKVPKPQHSFKFPTKSRTQSKVANARDFLDAVRLLPRTCTRMVGRTDWKCTPHRRGKRGKLGGVDCHGNGLVGLSAQGRRGGGCSEITIRACLKAQRPYRMISLYLLLSRVVGRDTVSKGPPWTRCAVCLSF